jgi:sialate O-acetylesterase
VKNTASTFFFLLFIQMVAFAKVIMPHVFSDNMVLQRNLPIAVWGKSYSGERVEVRFNGQQLKTTADLQGNWKIVLHEEQAGGPFELAIIAGDTIRFKNVLVGEVWVCSGQSNMEWKVVSSNDASREMKSADYPMIRHIKIPRLLDTAPQNDIGDASWQICSSTTVGEFTAVGYFFARRIFEELKVPVGIINCSWGGTNIETWISRGALESSEEFKNELAAYPQMSMDSLNAILTRPIVNRILEIKGIQINPIADHFAESKFDDENWPEMKLPGFWEQRELGEMDGVVWFRKKIDIPDSLAGRSAFLELSMIDDQDITYVNGTEIGRNFERSALRKYKIPEGLLKRGVNTIAVRVTDNGNNGGIHGEASQMLLKIANTSFPLDGNWKYQLERVNRVGIENLFPSLCFNAMVNPITSFGIKGVLWYQGESNVVRADQYRTAFPTLITDWRKRWKQGDFPFYFVQLSTYNNKGNSNDGCPWAELREAQSLTLSVPNTGMCVTTDVGNPNDIHPTDKKTVGERLAAIALNNNYGKGRVCSGPVYKSLRQVGEKIEISFENIGSGLKTNDKYGYLKGFEIAGEDQVFYFAKAEISGNKILVYSDKVTKPVAVHYGWMGDASECNVFNKEGFPLGPFRSVEWKTVTKGNKYTISALK